MDFKMIISKATSAQSLLDAQTRIYQVLGRANLDAAAHDELMKEVDGINKSVENYANSIRRCCS